MIIIPKMITAHSRNNNQNKIFLTMEKWEQWPPTVALSVTSMDNAFPCHNSVYVSQCPELGVGVPQTFFLHFNKRHAAAHQLKDSCIFGSTYSRGDLKGLGSRCLQSTARHLNSFYEIYKRSCCSFSLTSLMCTERLLEAGENANW